MSTEPFILKLDSYSYIDITGIDSAKFLQGQLSINTETPTNNQASLAALCNPKGRIVSLFHIIKLVEGFRLIMPTSIISSTLAHLNKYGVFYKIDIEESRLNNLFAIGNIQSVQLTEMKKNHLFSDFYHLGSPQLAFILDEENQSVSMEQIKKAIPLITIVDESYWFSTLVNYRISWLTDQSTELFLPHSLDLPNLSAVDFTKGCFTGQEVIARMQYKGKLKQHLQLLKSDKSNLVVAGEKLRQENNTIGEVVCSIITENDGTLALGLVKDSANKEIELETSSGSQFKIQENSI